MIISANGIKNIRGQKQKVTIDNLKNNVKNSHDNNSLQTLIGSYEHLICGYYKK
jgi:hypothetical protein